MIRHFWPKVQQYATHSDLLGRPRPGVRRTPAAFLDAIIVPASRNAENLDHAAELARAVECRLVVLCSLDAKGAVVASRLASLRAEQAVVVDVYPGYQHELLKFETSDLTRETLPRRRTNPNGDLSLKRNLSLLLARMVGWKRIFFLDDDIRGLRPDDLALTVSMLDRYRVAGLRIDQYPDNSVVCHARRETGNAQGVFIAGSVLAIDCDYPVSFFPEIYNEDWFFFYDDVEARRAGCSQRYAKQLRYDPFGNPQRATQQEFGDLLAEGLYALLHRGVGLEYVTSEYWASFISARRELIDEIKKHASNRLSRAREKLIDALDRALESLINIQPQDCENYIRAWRGDLRDWRQKISSLACTESINSALCKLELTPASP
jgi:glycosyltransferase involved in cell wall biosynthesis